MMDNHRTMRSGMRLLLLGLLGLCARSAAFHPAFLALPPRSSTSATSTRCAAAAVPDRGDPGALGAPAPTRTAAAPPHSLTKVSPPASADDSTKNNPATSRSSSSPVAVVICPAQFCVPDDYAALVTELPRLALAHETKIRHVVVAPLPRTEWIKVARKVPTPEFWTAELSVPETLSWYFEAIDKAVSDVLAAQAASRSRGKGVDDDDDDWTLCLVGHSIGGWVARAYLGGLSHSSTAAHAWAQERCRSLVTLGTPHAAPSDASPTWLDQTRGLLRAIDSASSCGASALAERGIDVTCVASRAVAARPSADPEELLALASYLPLLGTRFRPGATGDGIVPLELALMDSPARHLIVESCPQTGAAVRHAHVLPTPWNLWDGASPSIPLHRVGSEDRSNFASYLSPGIVLQWAQHIR